MAQFVDIFDESLCEATQTKRMDCHVRFWNDSRKLVTRRYLGAQFMEHGDAAKLVDCCHDSEAYMRRRFSRYQWIVPMLTGNFIKMFAMIFSVMICPLNLYSQVAVDCTSFIIYIKIRVRQ